jgi:Flp pilus assembly protein TadG
MKVKTKTFLATLRDKKGQNLVEFALVVPLLLLLVIGIAEFGRAWMTKNILTGAAREAARIAAVPDNVTGLWNGAAAIARGNQILSSASIPTTVSVVDSPTGAFGDVTATASYLFPVAVAGFIPGLDCTTILLSSTTTMRREY